MYYKVVILMKDVGTHQKFISAFMQFVDELTHLVASNQFHRQTIQTCWIERNWSGGKASAYLEEIRYFAEAHDLVKSGRVVLNLSDIDEQLVEKFYIQLRDRFVEFKATE